MAPRRDGRVVLRDPQGKGPLRAELGQIDAEVGRLAAAIAGGGELPALLAAVQERERRRAQLRTELAGLNRERTTAGLDAGQILDDLREQLTDWQMVFQNDPQLPARFAHCARACCRRQCSHGSMRRSVSTRSASVSSPAKSTQDRQSVQKPRVGSSVAALSITAGSHGSRWSRSA
jgi:hypothetical protein